MVGLMSRHVHSVYPAADDFYPTRQRWRGHVKARHFILALRDYWFKKVEDWKRGESTDPRISEINQGFLEILDVSRLQAITEAFDEDASGLITVAEVNQFTSSRPQRYTYVSHQLGICVKRADRFIQGCRMDWILGNRY